MNRRLIGEFLPLKLISEESTKEKNSNNNISTIHQWFARRPLTASRATAYAALIDLDKVDKRDAVKTLEELSYNKNIENKTLLEKAQKHILKSFDGEIPKILDPFGGGGSIPLECMRLGCETYSNDYNPVAHMVQKGTLYYPQKYGNVSMGTNIEDSKLLSDIQKYIKRIEEEAWKELGEFYPNTKNGKPATYIWARIIPCSNLKCNIDIPILTSYLLDKKNNVSMYPVMKNNKVVFKIVGGKYGKVPDDHDIGGNMSRNYVTCQNCQTTIKPADTNKLLQTNFKEQLVVVVEKPNRGSKMFISPTDKDIESFNACKNKLVEVRKTLNEKRGVDPIPTEIIEMPDGHEYKPGAPYWAFNRLCLGGQTKYSHLFNNRQQLVLITMFDKIRNLYDEICNEDEEYAKCIFLYLCFIIDKLISKYCKMSAYNSAGCVASDGMSGSAIKKTPTYAESNPFDKGGLCAKTKSMFVGLMQASKVNSTPATLTLGSATKLKYTDNYFDAVFTDPPYYEYVPYADFSDIYYIWLKRGLGDVFSDAFKTRLSPKRQELIVNDIQTCRYRPEDKNKSLLSNLKSKQHYEDGMSEAVTEMYRVLKPDGIITLVYTHSSLDGWETLIKAIKKSGFVITAAWPLNTETTNRVSAQNKASVQSSIYMVGRKWQREELGLYSSVKTEMTNNLKIKLKEFTNTLNKTDYLIAAIGFALEYFTKYESVIKDSGEEVTVCEMLADIRKFTINHKMEELTNSKITEAGISRLYIMFRWMYGESSAPYDHTRKIFQGCGINMDEYEDDIVVKKGSTVKILNAFERDIEKIPENNMINILHKAILYRDFNRIEDYENLLKKHEYDNNDTFKTIASGIVRVQEVSTDETKVISSMLKSHEMQKGTLDNFTDKKLNSNKHDVVT